MNRSNIVVTSRGIGIGSAYIPPAPRQGLDADAIQAALLSDHTARFEKVLDWINKAAPYAYGLMVGAGVVVWVVAKVLR